MNYYIKKIDAENYTKFDDMVYWRMNGKMRETSSEPANNFIKDELLNPNLYVYSVDIGDIYVGWISLIYMPKVGRFGGHGHIYVDELWIEPSYRNKGLAKALMKKADELLVQLKASGIRLYVNVDNPNAQKLYENCSFKKNGVAVFMEK